jgi:hypothetical protein
MIFWGNEKEGMKQEVKFTKGYKPTIVVFLWHFSIKTVISFVNLCQDVPPHLLLM